jgi:hypothetical protein
LTPLSAFRCRPTARMKAFTCEAACADKWRRHGPSQREDPLEGCDAIGEADAALAERPPSDLSAIAPPDLAPASRAAVRELWAAMDAAFVGAGGLHVVLPPGRRGFGGTAEVDFVAAGKRMPPADVAAAKRQLAGFRQAAPSLPGVAVFGGRGVVLVGYASASPIP